MGEEGDLAYSAVVELGETDGTDEIIESDAQSLFDLLSGTSVSNAPDQLIALPRISISVWRHSTKRCGLDWVARSGKILAMVPVQLKH